MPDPMNEQRGESKLNSLGTLPDPKTSGTTPSERLRQEQVYWWRRSAEQVQRMGGKLYAWRDIEC